MFENNGRPRKMATARLQEAEGAISELNRQIADRQQLSIPTIGLEDELREITAARDTLSARMSALADSGGPWADPTIHTLTRAKQRLTRARREVAAAEALVKRQEHLIERLRAAGQATAAAGELLQKLQDMHAWRASECERAAADLRELNTAPTRKINHG